MQETSLSKLNDECVCVCVSVSASVILCTAGYDHTIRFWQATSAQCHRSIQHNDSVRPTANPKLSHTRLN